MDNFFVCCQCGQTKSLYESGGQSRRPEGIVTVCKDISCIDRELAKVFKKFPPIKTVANEGG